MKPIVFCFILSGLEALFFTLNGKGKNISGIAHATSTQMEETQTGTGNNLRITGYTSPNSKEEPRDEENENRALQFNSKDGLLTAINHYLMSNLQRSMDSLLNWDKIVQIILPGAESKQEASGQRGHIAEMKVKKELTFFVLLIILKTLGVLVTKIKIVIGMVFLKLIIGKLILLFMHLKHSKHHAGPLIKAYQTTTNEFHNHLDHDKSWEFNNREPFYPSPPNLYIHDPSMRK